MSYANAFLRIVSRDSSRMAPSAASNSTIPSRSVLAIRS